MKGVRTSRIKMLEIELQPYMDVFQKATDTILDQEVSDYPIMVVHQEETVVGLPMVNRKEVAGNWSVNASTLEEFMMKKVITEEKFESFKSL